MKVEVEVEVEVEVDWKWEGNFAATSKNFGSLRHSGRFQVFFGFLHVPSNLCSCDTVVREIRKLLEMVLEQL